MGLWCPVLHAHTYACEYAHTDMGAHVDVMVPTQGEPETDTGGGRGGHHSPAAKEGHGREQPDSYWHPGISGDTWRMKEQGDGETF